MRVLIVTAVEAERSAIARHPNVEVIAGGVGRTNAACATTERLLADRFDVVLNAGVAVALPGGGLRPGHALVASRCVYVEEGMLGPGGFVDIASIGLSLGDFEGNAVPVDAGLLDVLSLVFPVGPIATVAAVSGTDERAAEVVKQTGALAEAMEGAAVVHAARRQGVPAIELRVMSNLTGNRQLQQWDLAGALAALGPAVDRAIDALSAASDSRTPTA